MTYAKGDRVVLTRIHDGYDAGAKGRIIRVDTHVFSADDYTVLLDDDGKVIDRLSEDDLFVTDPANPET